jgi:hypothetical protein
MRIVGPNCIGVVNAPLDMRVTFMDITPIQPRLAESNLFQVSSGGPTGLAFNEFNSLFNRDRATLQTTGVTGSNDTYGGEGIVSGVYKRASFSVGYDHFTSDGFRPNDDQRDDIVDAFFQAELTSQTSIQTEYRYRNREQGDLQLRFFPDDFRPNERQSLATHTYRVGGRHTFGPDNIVLASYIPQELDDTLHDEPGFPVTALDVRGDLHADGGEAQLFRSRWVNLVSGVGHVPSAAPIAWSRISTRGARPRRAENDRDIQHQRLFVCLRRAAAEPDVHARRQRRLLQRRQCHQGAQPVQRRRVSPGRLGEHHAACRGFRRSSGHSSPTRPSSRPRWPASISSSTTATARLVALRGAVDQKFTDRIFGGVEYQARSEVPFEFVQPEAAPARSRRPTGTNASHERISSGRPTTGSRSASSTPTSATNGQEFTFGVRRWIRIASDGRELLPSDRRERLSHRTYVNQDGVSSRTPRNSARAAATSTSWTRCSGIASEALRLRQRRVTNLFDEHSSTTTSTSPTRFNPIGWSMGK